LWPGIGSGKAGTPCTRRQAAQATAGALPVEAVVPAGLVVPHAASANARIVAAASVFAVIGCIASSIEFTAGRLGACTAPGYEPVTVLSRRYPPCAILCAVRIGGTLHQPVSRILRPQPTVRGRLTLLYSGLFLICGAALLAITYVLFVSFPTEVLGVGLPIHPELCRARAR
jgi:hypothetical protein